MAARRNAVAIPEQTLSAADVLAALVKLNAYEDTPRNVGDVADELAELPETVFNILDEMETAKLVETVRGSVWLTVDATEESAVEIVAEAMNGGVEDTEPVNPIVIGLPLDIDSTTHTEPVPSVESWEAPVFESTIPEYDGPDSIPAPPFGVNANTWELAHYAPTATGRKFWIDRVNQQIHAADVELASA